MTLLQTHLNKFREKFGKFSIKNRNDYSTRPLTKIKGFESVDIENFLLSCELELIEEIRTKLEKLSHGGLTKGRDWLFKKEALQLLDNYKINQK